MRIVFVNLHASWMLLKNSAVIIFKNSAALKHKYILDYAINNPNIEVATYLNDRAFSIYKRGGRILQKILNRLAPMEHRWILKKNGIDDKIITIITKPEDIGIDDIVIAYNVFNDSLLCLRDIHAFKVLSMLHFGGDEKENSVIEQANINCYFNECNLEQTSEIFRRYYTVKRPWIVIPFVFAPRFENRMPFNRRKNKAFSVGTITYKHNPEFIEVYGEPCDQPVRKMVKDNPEFFADTIDCYSSDYLEDDDVKEVKPTDNTIIKIYKRIHNRFNTGQQKRYFSFDMVEKFNEYKMHIVGEEILGVPGIGYVEGMACGSAYIGLDSPMYRDLGLIPGVHYIAYDGTKEGLKSTIEYWQRPENQDALEKIATTGCVFVRENFSGEKVAAALINKLIKLKNTSRNK